MLNKLETKTKRTKMLAIYMSHLSDAAGLLIPFAFFARALYAAKNRHRTIGEAANDQQTWVDASELYEKSKIDTQADTV